MTIALDRDLAKDLIESKIQQLDIKIQEILEKWHIDSIQVFLDKTKAGDLVEAVPDAISLKNLIDKRTELTNKLTEESLQ